ncbi:putative ABC transporter permease [Clostridium sp. 19966]|uniref:putative ABC transporter permease n=1 Tax=Clostridium sp. 19966 TaxID=2768166 RepID=UPI0028DF481A|nr:putative ABC transporter permease [Clostridium sp. 19966]MDT8717241.1 putative ABC transporter permease [Clostridium sp. 19966]
MYYNLFFSFIIYAFLGWALEVIFKLITEKKFINRGFLHGPLCPIYGITGMIMMMIAPYMENNVVYIFFSGTIMATIAELIVGYLLEKLFDTKWWDYSKNVLNYKGYICLQFSLGWGLLAVISIIFINPLVENIIKFMIEYFGQPLYQTLLVLLVIDITLTINDLIEFKRLFIELQDILSEIKLNVDMLVEKANSNDVKTVIQEKIKSLEKMQLNLLGRLNFKQKILLKAYPKLYSRRYNEAIIDIRKKLDRLKSKKLR